jgi:hypothetical protein
MSSINDWAAKAAQRIADESHPSIVGSMSLERIAAIIATFAEPLVALLRESRREHRRHCDKEASSPCDCGSGHCPINAVAREAAKCTCGADAWNARVDKALE